MGSFGPTLCLFTACHSAVAHSFLHGSLVLGCPSVRVYDPRVVESGIEYSSLSSAFPGHPLPAANTASFTDTFFVPGTDIVSDTHEIVGACYHLLLDMTEWALTPSASDLAPLLADAVIMRTSHPVGDEARPEWRGVGGVGALEKVDPFSTHDLRLDTTECALNPSASDALTLLRY